MSETKHLHFLGICGTFMGSLAVLAKEMGYRVTGSDQNVYPPMSTQLEQKGIKIHQGFDPGQLDPAPDLVIVGNAMSRGNPAVEHMLNRGIHYTSGPEWLKNAVLKDRWVIAASGTHGKTTTTSMALHILEACGFKPGYLVGGVPLGFEASARLGESDFFVIEADEYDTAFFDKRSKFIHYLPRTLIFNNLEFDHGDIFDTLADIQRQFHHMIRTIPSEGQILYPRDTPAITEVLDKGCWSDQLAITVSEEGAELSNAVWEAQMVSGDGQSFKVYLNKELQGQVNWSATGKHNVYNGLMAIASAHHVGILPLQAIEALSQFGGVKRRMELLLDKNGVRVYDDFAHHPTAIETTLQGARAALKEGERLIAVFEPRSNTMKMGVHQDLLADSFKHADQICWFEPEGLNWSLQDVAGQTKGESLIFQSVDKIVDYLAEQSQPGDRIVIMSNGGFGGIHQKLISRLGNL